MKYGNIICDPTSDEAKRLIGKEVIGGYSYTEAMDGKGEKMTLDSIDRSCKEPFFGYSKCGFPFRYTFIREVIEEKPTYRPYEDTTEMVEDFKERFKDKIIASPVEMPLIWMKNKLFGSRILVTEFHEFSVPINGMTTSFEKIFNQYTYLDGSPVGKEVKE